MSEQVLHLDFIALNPGTTAEQRGSLEAAAAALLHIDGVIGAGTIDADGESDFDVGFWFLLRDFAALEPFGTDPRYSRFLQGNVAPLLQSFAGADVKLEDDFPAADGAAACLALLGPEEAYDFEVRETLESWARQIGASSAALGLAVGEKQLYRGAGIGFGGRAQQADKPTVEPFTSTLLRGRARTFA